MPTEEIVQNFNDLRQDIVLLYELKLALATCDYELETLRHQYEVLNPGKVGIIYCKYHKEFSCSLKVFKT